MEILFIYGTILHDKLPLIKNRDNIHNFWSGDNKLTVTKSNTVR